MKSAVTSVPSACTIKLDNPLLVPQQRNCGVIAAAKWMAEKKRFASKESLTNNKQTWNEQQQHLLTRLGSSLFFALSRLSSFRYQHKTSLSAGEFSGWVGR